MNLNHRARRTAGLAASLLLAAPLSARGQELSVARLAAETAPARVASALAAPLAAPSLTAAPSFAALCVPLGPAAAVAPAATVAAEPSALAPQAAVASSDERRPEANAATARERAAFAGDSVLAPEPPLEEPGVLFDGSGSRGASASRVALLSGPGESLAARAQMLASARGSVDAGYYEFREDETGLTKLAQLRAAARRGRRVRLLLDPHYNKLSKATLRHLRDEGVDIRIYHPLTFAHPSWLWRRSHDKWTIVDGREMIVGDANMADAFFGRGPAPWRSREAYVSGAAARRGRAYVDAIWSGSETRAPRGLDAVSAEDAAAAALRLDAFESPDAADAPRPWAERAHATAVRFVSNGFFRPRRGAGIGNELLALIRSANESIVIENAYVSLPKVFREELARAIRERGVRVVVITNSRRSNNLSYAADAYEVGVPELLRMGVELYEFGGPGTLHAKGMVVDGRRAYIGSFNLNPWAFLFNTETGVIVDAHPGFARDLLSRMEQTRRESVLVGRAGVRLSAPRRAPALWRRAVIFALTRFLLGG